jgi:hypothetical protein
MLCPVVCWIGCFGRAPILFVLRSLGLLASLFVTLTNTSHENIATLVTIISRALFMRSQAATNSLDDRHFATGVHRCSGGGLCRCQITCLFLQYCCEHFSQLAVVYTGFWIHLRVQYLSLLESLLSKKLRLLLIFAYLHNSETY